MIHLTVNDQEHDIAAEAGELLVWVIHEKLGLTKTRFGCGIASCGACKVLVDDKVVQSCKVQVGDVLGKKITTREALPAEFFALQDSP